MSREELEAAFRERDRASKRKLCFVVAIVNLIFLIAIVVSIATR